MYQGPFKLHDIIHKDGKDILEVIDIVYKPDNRFKHSLNITEHPIGSGSIESCKEQNDKQLTFLLECRENVESRLRANKRSPKIKNLLEYYASSYDQYFNWYTGKRLVLPGVSPEMVHVKNKFASNWNFSVVKLDNKVFYCNFMGVGSCTLTGRVNNFTMNMNGVGSVNAKELIANIVDANVNGVGSAEVYAIDSLHAAVNGIGSLTYYGNPKKKDISNSFLGKITKGKKI